MKRKGTIILTMLLVFVIEVCLIYTLKGKMDTLLQFTKIFSVFLRERESKRFNLLKSDRSHGE